MDFNDKDEFLKDTKFYIRKLKNEIFSFDKVISFENLIPSEEKAINSYEANVCEALHLERSGDLMASIARAYELDKESCLQGLLLVPDNLS